MIDYWLWLCKELLDSKYLNLCVLKYAQNCFDWWKWNDLYMRSAIRICWVRERDLSPSLVVSGFWLFPAFPNLSPVCRTNGATRERIWARTALMEVLGKWHKHPRFKDELNFLDKMPSKLLHKWMCKSLSCCRLQNTIHFVWVSSKKCVVIVQRR